MENVHRIFEDAIHYLVARLKEKKRTYFLRENDLTCFLYAYLYHKFKKKDSFTHYDGKNLFLIHTEHQCERLEPIHYLKGKAIDLVILNSTDTKIKIAVEIKFNKKTTKSNRKSSAGKGLLIGDVKKLSRLKKVPYKYLLYYKEGGDCFLTKGRHKDKNVINFCNKIKEEKNLRMYYIEKEDEETSNSEFNWYVINKDYELIKLNSKRGYNTNKHFNIFIISNSRKTYQRAK